MVLHIQQAIKDRNTHDPKHVEDFREQRIIVKRFNEEIHHAALNVVLHRHGVVPHDDFLDLSNRVLLSKELVNPNAARDRSKSRNQPITFPAFSSGHFCSDQQHSLVHAQAVDIVVDAKPEGLKMFVFRISGHGQDDLGIRQGVFA